MRQPWMKFYPADWRAEPKLRLISREARSLWLDMVGLMFEAGTGRLEVAGRPMTERELAATLGDNPRTVKKLLSEIEGAGVSSRDGTGFIYSRRIIRDFERAEKDKSNGRKGGNPALKNKGLDENVVNPEVKAQMLDARCQSSVSKDTGADAPPDADKVFWDSAKNFIGGSNPGAMIGKWIRDHGKSEAAAAISDAQVNRAVEPRAYIQKILTKAKQADWEFTGPC